MPEKLTNLNISFVIILFRTDGILCKKNRVAEQILTNEI